MTPPAGTGPPRVPVPPGWPGDDPTEPEDLALLGGRRRGRHRRGPDPPRPPRRVGRTGRAAAGRTRRAGAAARRRRGHRGRRRRRRSPCEDIPVDLEHDDAVAGRQPAGRVLVIIVAALVLAMLVNADALVARGERQPPGRAGDGALAVGHPVQDVSHALQLHRIRSSRTGRSATTTTTTRGPRPSPRHPARPRRRRGPKATTTTSPEAGGAEAAPAAVELPTPTAGAPLRLWVGGDSMAQVFGPALATAAGATASSSRRSTTRWRRA